jgi:predicted PhzF superfamily epimerase YddE/YHI9
MTPSEAPVSRPIYQIDAFVSETCRGNPAAVVLLDAWPEDDLLQAVAEENRLPETAFLVPGASPQAFALRWFSPRAEVPLCGHATLASAYVLFHETGVSGERLVFSTRSGPLEAIREGEDITLDLPTASLRPLAPSAGLRPFLGGDPEEFFAYGEDGLAVLPDEEAVRASRVPDETALDALGLRGLCVTARGREADVVSRFFAPGLGIPEDPVTGSAHCAVAPYWGRRLGRTSLRARQLSERGGALRCRWEGARVRISGRARRYLSGTIGSPLPGRSLS